MNDGTGNAERIKVLVLGERSYYERILPDNPYLASPGTVFVGKDASNDDAVAALPDAQALLADAVTTVDADLIARLPNLRLVNSEGVGFDRFDLDAAHERGVFVCNNPGMNAHAVAEQAVLLMLGLLREVVPRDAAVRDGRQNEAKMAGMRAGITDLADCTVGLVGLGSIGQATAERLRAFGCRVLYSGRSRKSAELEERFGVRYAELDGLLAQSDIVSLHCAVTPETRTMADAAFFAQMRPGAYLVNTARGDLVDNDALADALTSGHLGGAGLDTIAPEPVPAGHVLLDLPPEAARRVLFSPHIGGVTTGSMRKGQAHMWENVARIERGERPDAVVNGL